MSELEPQYLKSKHPFVGDGRVIFRETLEDVIEGVPTNLNHVYTLEGRGHFRTSVTGFVHSFSVPFDAKSIIAKMRRNKAKFEAGRYKDMTDEEIEKDWEVNRERAATEGTKIHRQIELYLNKEITENRPQSREFQFFIDFYNDCIVKEDLVVWRTELVIYSEKLAIAGSIDLILYDPKTDSYIIGDWKRSSKIETHNPFQKLKFPISHLSDCNTNLYSLQLNVYKYILETEFGMKIREKDGLKLIFLHPTQQCHAVFNCPNLQTEVKKMFEHREMLGQQCFRHEPIVQKTLPTKDKEVPLLSAEVPFIVLSEDECREDKKRKRDEE